MYERMIQNSYGVTSPFIRDKLRISITNQCNLKCHYCHNEGQGQNCESHFLSMDYIDDLIDYCIRGSYKLKKINITGGEPLLHPQLNDIVKKISKITDSLRINTNTVLLTEDWARELIALGVSEFKFGIDSLWSETDFSEIKTENLDRIYSLVNAIKEMGGSVVINMVVTLYNHHLIDDMVSICQYLCISHLKIIEQVTCESFSHSGLFKPAYKEYQNAYEKYRKKCVRFEPDVDAGMDDMYLESGLKVRWCESFCRSRACATMYTIINAEGKIVACPKKTDSLEVDFSKSRDIREIDSDLRLARAKICSVTERRYLRDINGNFLPERDPLMHRWKWEEENNSYWYTPEPVVYELIRRWKNGIQLLDLGCGMGRNAFVFAKEGYQVTAIDNSSYAIDYVKKQKNPNITATIMDMSSLKIPNDSMDYIFAFNSLSHSDDYLLSLAIREIYRVLRPEGEIWLTLCSKNADGWNDLHSPIVSEHTRIKMKPGPEFGVAHYYADLEDVLFLFREFTIIDIRHVNHCYYDNAMRNSWHYQVLLKKDSNKYRTRLCSRAQ